MKVRNLTAAEKARRQVLCARDQNHRVVALKAGYSEKEFEELLSRNPGWYRSQFTAQA